MYSEKRKFGNLGENIACKFLKSKGFEIVERNYLVRVGELDIIAEKKGVINFIEVKTVSYDENFPLSHESEEYRAEENLHPQKLKRASRAIQIYLSKMNPDQEWIFDVVIVRLDRENKKAKVKFIEDIVL